MRHLLELLLPARLGMPFRRIFAAAGASNVGDGILLAAGPLLVASLTRDPFLISLALLAQQLPWFLVSILAGVVADRVSRVRLLVLAESTRVVALLGIVVLLLTGTLTVWWLYALLFVVGLGEVFFDNAWNAMVPDAVPHVHLGVANARMSVLFNVGNQLAGPAIGGALFALGAVWPLSTTALLLVVAIVVLLRLRVDRPPRPEGTETGPILTGGVAARIRRSTTSGLRWLWGNDAIRTLFLAITLLNVTFGMTWSVLVVVAHERLGLSDVGYGLLLACSAVGGIAGALLFGRLERHFSYGTLMRVCLTLEVLLHAALALTTHPIVAGVILVVFGAYASVWGVLGRTVQSRVIPSHIRGRVSSVYLLGVFGAIAVGAPVGGWIAQQFGVTTTLWAAAAVTAVIVVAVWRQLPSIGRAGGSGAAGPDGSTPPIPPTPPVPDPLGQD